jgi:hypothetical protein
MIGIFMSDDEKRDSSNTVGRNLASNLANQISGEDDKRHSEKLLKYGLGIATAGVLGVAASPTLDSPGLYVASGVLGAGGIAGALVATSQYNRARRRVNIANEGIQDQLDQGVVWPTKEKPYFTLPDGTIAKPNKEFLDRLTNSGEPSNERGR